MKTPIATPHLEWARANLGTVLAPPSTDIRRTRDSALRRLLHGWQAANDLAPLVG
jgi:hypothetical protein